jgi:ABC-type dipeptide/oligopeptide/nickel transport system ATPase component
MGSVTSSILGGAAMLDELEARGSVTADLTTSAILEVVDYGGYFSTAGSVKPALCGVTFSVPRGAMTAVVGETGSGKTLTALSVLRIQPKSFIRTSGRILFNGLDLLTMAEADLQAVRGAQISMAFQDARMALNPVFSVGRQIADVFRLHQNVSAKQARQLAINALREVHIADPERRARQYPHEFSGGMAQRVMIAMALSCRPQLLILDEPTTGLDVTIQAEIMSLILELGRNSGLTTCLITHDLGIVAESCDYVIVMRRGEVVEAGTCEQIMTQPGDTYTRQLLDASRLVGRV